jgi:hypothetical protein
MLDGWFAVLAKLKEEPAFSASFGAWNGSVIRRLRRKVAGSTAETR